MSQRALVEDGKERLRFEMLFCGIRNALKTDGVMERSMENVG